MTYFNLDDLDNLLMLASTVIALLISLFKYIEKPRKGWLYVSVFFLARFLSDYYWTTYTFIMNDDPDISALMAYFGWNASYLIQLVSVIKLRPKEVKGYINPLMFLPIPLNIAQCVLYSTFGGIFNNIVQVGFTTASICFCLQSSLYYLKNKKNGAFIPYYAIFTLAYLIAQYGMWTASCFDWDADLTNPFYYFAFTGYVLAVFLSWSVGKDYKVRGEAFPERSPDEIKTVVILQAIVSIIILGCCGGGVFLASWMKNALPAGSEDSSSYTIIAIVLFIISVFLVALILAVIYMIAFKYKTVQNNSLKNTYVKRSRFNLIFTILVTLLLMIFAVVYNSAIYYRASVSSIYESGEEKSDSTATELENYLTKAMSTLKVTADSIELMVQNDVPQEQILQYILDQTRMQSIELDENFTGLYGYIRGEYLDGLGWEPPADYNATERDWYRYAIDGQGKTVIVSPYVDAQTKSVVITFTKLLLNDENGASNSGQNVAALDVIVNYIQDTTEQVELNGKGYAMIVNEDGFIVAHKDKDMNGLNFRDIYGNQLLDIIKSTKNGNLQAKMGDEDCTLFISDVMDQWYVVVAVSNHELFEDMYSQLAFNILVSLVIFALITFFYYIGYMNEQASSKKMEEMSANKQKQEYEAEVLRLEKRSADEANKAKSKFLADMSHEIRTPINAILGMNEMILREANDKNLREYSRNIAVSGKNLLQLINSILDFSKIEDGKMEIVPVSYSVHSLITYLINSVQERALAKGLSFNVNIDPHIPSQLYGDDTRINQIILNLLTNAIKYTPEGSVTFSMREKERSEGKALIYVEVKDTGIGIKESDMDRLFESFERLDETRNHNIEGTGLGISITTSLLKLMDSELKVRSIYGEGSVFSFELWQKIESEEALGDYKLPAEDNENEAYTESFHAPSARILIVDDTRMNLTVAVNLLKNTQIMIDTAISGEEAIGLVERTAYDLILMDQRMPGLSGTQTLNEIRALNNKMNDKTPVICLTADAIRGAREKYLAEGFSDYLTKPIEGRALERALITYLPAEKVEREFVKEDRPAAEANDTESPLFKALREAGIDTSGGMNYSMNTEDVYLKILAEYASEFENRSRSIKEYYEKKDWENYSVYVHSLKSTSRTIGATALSGIAAELEAAANNRDENTIMQKHESAIAQYTKIASVIRDNMDISQSVKEDGDDDDDILEFAPSGDDNDDDILEFAPSGNNEDQ